MPCQTVQKCDYSDTILETIPDEQFMQIELSAEFEFPWWPFFFFVSMEYPLFSTLGGESYSPQLYLVGVKYNKENILKSYGWH